MAMPSSMSGLHALSRALGTPYIPHDVAKPFLDVEKDRNRMMNARMWAAPAGAMAMHIPWIPASVVPGVHGAAAVAPSAAILEGLGLNAPMQSAAGDLASTVAGHMGPIFLMGSLGALGGIGAGMGASKLLRWLAKRREAKRKAQQTPYENPILGM